MCPLERKSDSAAHLRDCAAFSSRSISAKTRARDSARRCSGTSALQATLCARGSWQNLDGVAAPKRKQSSRIPVKSQSRSTSTAPKPPRRRVIDPDELEELEDDDAHVEAISQDHALTLFFRRPPAGADHVIVVAHTPAGDQIVEDRSTSEVIKDPARHANAVSNACTRWAQTEGRQTRFRATWHAGDRVLASHQLVCGEGDPSALDGTVESFLSQQQRHSEVDHRLHHEGFSMVQDAWQKLLAGSMKRIDALERDNESLRERLRKAGDVEAEILTAQAVADIDQRARTTDIVESRLMPIVQQLLVKHLGSGPAPANDNNDAEPTKQIETMLRQVTGGDPGKLRELLGTLTTPTA